MTLIIYLSERNRVDEVNWVRLDPEVRCEMELGLRLMLLL